MDTAWYSANFLALSCRSPELACLVDATEPYPLELLRARSGATTAKAGGAWLHSQYDPHVEGQKLADEAMATSAELVVLLGLGLGYAARSVLASGGTIVVVESRVPWLAALLHAANLADIISDKRCALILCPEGRGLDEFLDETAPRSIAVIENRATLSIFPEDATILRAQITRFRKKDEINTATLRRFGRLWVRNLSRNIRTAAACPGLAAFTGMFKGFPALVLAAGPSLDEILQQLPELAERMVIICVDTALRSALRVGVEPDFVLVVDPQYWNMRHLDRCSSPGSVLVTEAAVWPSVLRFKVRQMALCSSIYPLGRYVENRLGPPKGSLGAGGSVATSAWDFARILGCVPIYMAGLDLSFPEGKTHAKASLFEQRSLSEGTRLDPASSTAFRAMRGGRPYRAMANDGSDVTSDERLSLYSTWFAHKLVSHPDAPTYNLSSRGLAIPGMDYVSMRILAGLPERRKELDSLLTSVIGAMESADGFGVITPVEVEAVVSDLKMELHRLADMADRAVTIAEAALGSQGGMQQTLSELTSIDNAVLESKARDVVGFLFASAAEAVGGRAKNLDDSLIHTARLYRAVAESARWHSQSL